jgi:hypothetical protein
VNARPVNEVEAVGSLEEQTLIRAIALAIAGALLAVLALWWHRDVDSPNIGEPAEARPTSVTGPSSQLPAASVVEPLNASPEVPADASRAAPPRMEPNILAVIEGQPFPYVESPPWADEMENTILAYIAERPALELTDLQVQCAESGCVIFMGGKEIPVYQLNFDVFAEEHGFANAVIRGSDGSDRRIVFLRR